MLNDEHSDKGQSCDDEPPVTEENHTEERQPTAYEEESPTKPAIKWPSQVTINTISTVAMAVFTGTIWITSCNQLDSMRKQTETMKGQLDEMVKGSADTKTQADNTGKLALATESFAKSTQTSVEQAKASLGATISAAHLGQRAWVVIQNVQLCKDMSEPVCVVPSIDHPRTFYVDAHNFGTTPSLETIASVCIRDEIPDSIRKDCPITSPFKAMVAPNMSLFYNRMDRRTQGFDDTPQYVIGVIQYKDIFEVGHWVTFCHMSPNTNTSNISPCERGNDMDKQPEN